MYTQILDKIIKPEYRQSLADWQSYATESDKIGLELIDQIYKSKGNRPVKYKLP